MSWRKEQGRTERGYHHGNLKEALLQAALGLIAEKGAAGFTFADAARMAGVSPAAPYRHFRDRDELLSCIAQRGFEQFEAQLTRPGTTGVRTPSRRSSGSARPISPLPARSLRSTRRCSNPACRSISIPRCRPQANAPSNIIRAAAERLAALAPPGMPRPPAMMMALHIWSMSHGVASLFARGDAARRKLPMSPEDLLEAEVLIYLRGLGFPTDRRPPDQKPAGRRRCRRRSRPRTLGHPK